MTTEWAKSFDVQLKPVRPLNRGIAIGPVLFALAMLAVIAGFISATMSGGGMGAAISEDRVAMELRGQIELVKSKIQECVQLQARNPATGNWDAAAWPVRGASPPAWSTSTVYASGNRVLRGGHVYSAQNAGTSGSTAPAHLSGAVSDGGVTWTYLGPQMGVFGVECPAYATGRQNIWTGQRPAALPGPPPGFGHWTYHNGGTDDSRCIRIVPDSAQAARAELRRGIVKALRSMGPSEYSYDSASAGQEVIIWISRGTNPACPTN